MTTKKEIYHKTDQDLNSALASGVLRERCIIEDIADGGGGNSGKRPESLFAFADDALAC